MNTKKANSRRSLKKLDTGLPVPLIYTFGLNDTSIKKLPGFSGFETKHNVVLNAKL